MIYQTLNISKHNEKIKILELCNFRKLNVLSQKFFDEFNDIIDNLNEDKNIRTLIIKGNEKVFSAGGDLSEIQKAEQNEAYLMCWRVQKSFERLMSLRFPVIAVLDGIVFGGGFELALHCDLRFCTENTILRLPEVDMGLIPGAGGISIFSRFFSNSDAAYYLFSGEQIPVEEALKKGIIQKVLKREEILNFAINFAEEISQKPPESISAIKRILFSNLFKNLDDCMKMEAKEFSSVLEKCGKEKIKQFFDSRNL